MKRRIIAAAIITNTQDQLLLLKMSEHRGVYPGQWGIVGGGMDKGETMVETLHREVKEETNLNITEVTPSHFADDRKDKLLPDGTYIDVYMIYLMFDCVAKNPEQVILNDEWSEYMWVNKKDLKHYDLNEATQKTFILKGWL